MSKNQLSTQSEDSDVRPAAVDPALTLAQKKLAGSACCLNCGTPLRGPYCYYCGQPDRNFMRFFPALLRDLMEDFLDLDSRFMRTIKPLLFKPGRLTRDFLSGRRFRYTPPMRLYMFASIVFFLLAALLSGNAISLDKKNSVKHVIASDFQIRTGSAVEDQKLNEALDKLPEDIKKVQTDDARTQTENDGEEAEKPMFDTGEFSFNDKPWNRETNPVDIHWLPDWINDRINDEIEHSPQKAEQINNNPNLIVDKVFDILPVTMFVLLPVVALIFKFWYLFAKRYYVEHLIFSLHNHAFLFVSLVLILLLGEADDLLTSLGYQTSASVSNWLVTVIAVWIPVYLLVSLRVVYRQTWLLTLGKFAVIGFSYLLLLTMVTSIVAIASFVLL